MAPRIAKVATAQSPRIQVVEVPEIEPLEPDADRLFGPPLTRSEAAHRRQGKGRSHQYRGVIYYPQYKSWEARITYRGRTIHLGVRKTEKEAARLYDAAAKKLFGSLAVLNFY